MKTQLFNIFLFFLAISGYAQTYTVLDKVFDTNENTTALLNLSDTYISIEPSYDGKMYFHYTLSYENYSKKQIDKDLKNIAIDVLKSNNTIRLESTSILNSSSMFEIDEPNGLTISKSLFEDKSETEQPFIRKSKDSILKLINKPQKELLKDFLALFKTFDDKGNKKNINAKNVKIKRSYFSVKVPPYVKLKILAEKSNITIKEKFLNEVAITLNDGSLKIAHLSNISNQIEINDATFKAESISNGSFAFKNVKKSLIGSISNTNIHSEYSDIEFGEINENVRIVDFNSELWFHNFSENFKLFYLNATLSKVNIFYPKNDFTMNAFGNNTITYLGTTKVTLQPGDKTKKAKLFERKAKGKGHYSGEILIDIINSVMRTDY